MIPESLFINLLWLATMVLEAGILIVLFARGLHRLYFRFTLYIAWQLGGDILLACVQGGEHPYVYYFGYWAVSIVSAGLTLAILYEILQQMLCPLESGQRILSAVVRWIAFLTITLLPLRLLVMGGEARLDQITAVFLELDRDLRILVFAAGIGILLLGRWLRISQRKFVISIVAGFVMCSYLRLLIAMAISHRTVFHHSTLRAIDLAGWALADLLWFVYALRSPKVNLNGPAETSATGSLPSGEAYAS